jgi:hypothetical protein
MELSPVGEPTWVDSLDVRGPSWFSPTQETSYTARCTATLRVRGHCTLCTAEVEGEIVADGRGGTSRDPNDLFDLVRDIGDREAPLRQANAAARQEALDRATRALEVARCPVCRRRDPSRERQAAWSMGLGCVVTLLPWVVLLVLGRVAWSEEALAIATVASGAGVAVIWGQVARLDRAQKIRLTPCPSRTPGR